MAKAYADIFSSYCTKLMKTRIESHPDFSTNIYNKPIALLEAIKTLTHDPIRARYPFATLTDAMSRVINIRQHEKESESDFVKQLKQLKDVYKSHLGTDIFEVFVEATEEYRQADATEQQKLKDGAFEQWCAFLLIRNSDSSKFGSLQQGLINQYSLGNDQYPWTLSAAHDVLTNHHPDKKDSDQKPGAKPTDKSKTRTSTCPRAGWT